MRIKLKIKKLHPDAKLPFKKHDSDFCYDVYATSMEEIHPDVYRYHTGLAVQIDRNSICGSQFWDDKRVINAESLLDIDIRPRSSICNTGLVLANSEATIDEAYTGEIMLTFYHVVKTLPVYKVGDRIAQMKFGITMPFDFVEVEELDETDRGDGGYGNTGQN